MQNRSPNMLVTQPNTGIARIQYYGSDSYRNQGQEKDDEVKGKGNSVNFEYRMHDPRVGRFYAVDPLASEYSYYTPYAFSGNKLIGHREIEGLEEAAVIRFYNPKDIFIGTIVIPIPSQMRYDKGKVLIVNKTVTADNFIQLQIPHPSSLFTIKMVDGVESTIGLSGGRIVSQSVNKIEQDRLEAAMKGERYHIKQGTAPVPIPIDAADQIITLVSQDQLNIFKRALKNDPQFSLEITGHASNNDNASENYNIELSQRRGEATIEDLKSKGIEASRLIDGGGKGSSIPLNGNDNSTEVNRQKNRRSFSNRKR